MTYREHSPVNDKKGTQNVEVNVGYANNKVQVTTNNYEYPQSIIVRCPVCGRNNEAGATFSCQRCKRDNLCISHQESTSYLCRECHARTVPTIPEGVVCSSGHEFIEPLSGVTMRFVPGGKFNMGNILDASTVDSAFSGSPVQVSGFWLAKFPLTQGQYGRIIGMENNPSYFNHGPDHPLERISWIGAKRFIDTLAAQTNLPFRLPVEAEWEYAARSGGKPELYAGGSDAHRVAWFATNSTNEKNISSTMPVGRKAPNGLGLYDMSGNVWEWCSDRYTPAISSPDPLASGRTDGVAMRVIRGGSWFHDSTFLSTTCRYGLKPGAIYNYLGIRLALSNMK